MDIEVAEKVAVQALTFIASDPERLGRFIDLTGYTPAGIRKAAAEPEFLQAVIQHIVGYEPLLVEFAEAERMDPAEVVAVAESLGVSSTEWQRWTI